MLFAVIARCPCFGGELDRFDSVAAQAVPGVRAVFQVLRLSQPGSANKTAGGVAVVANSTWAAIQGRKALKVDWQTLHEPENSESLRHKFLTQVSAPPFYVAVNQGDALKALEAAEGKIEVSYELPLQAHAPMEPMNTTVHVQDDHVEVWSPTQTADETQREIAQLAGLPTNQVTVHTTLSGGSFGRRAQWDYPAEAWQIADKMRVPVQLMWTREDDIQHDFYRPYTCHYLTGRVDKKGSVIAWYHRVVSTSINAYFNWDGKAPDPAFIAELELGSFEDDSPYSAQNTRLEYNPVDTVVPRAWWRSVGTALNAFATESFIDELAHASKRDPYRYRLSSLREDRSEQTRKLRGVLQLAADKSDWDKPLPAGHGRGIACYRFGDTYVAQVAEVCVEKGTLRVDRVVGAVDCGLPVNPDSVRAQVESGINYALTPVLTGEITIKDGAVEQSNFHDYQVVRMANAPDIEVHLVPGGAEPRNGVGESGVPPLAPAVANAVFAATGVRIRRLPIDTEKLKKAPSS
jgi:isoquinoline 1-oxidoreductase subunit beta